MTSFTTLASPAHVCIELTNACNMSCAHCLYAVDRGEPRVLSGIALERAWEVVEHAEQIAADGGGEVLIDNESIALLARLAEKAPVAFTTNGKNLTPAVLDRLPLERISGIHVSFDGFDKEAWRLLRRGADPERIFKAITATAGEIERRGAPTDLWVNMVLTTLNMDGIDETIRRLAGAGVRHFHLIHLIVTDAAMERYSLFKAKDACNRALDEARAAAERLGVECVAPEPFGSPREPRGEAWPGHYPCGEPFSAAFIRSDGAVTACCDPRMMMGDLNDHDFQTVWRSDEYRRLRQALNSAEAPAICRRCIHPKYMNVDSLETPECIPAKAAK